MSFLNIPTSLSTIFLQNRMIDTIEVEVILNEGTTDTLTITKQPVQQGASITDHAYKEPTTLSMTVYFQNKTLSSFLSAPLASITSPQTRLAALYKQLLELQESRFPFVVVTPKRTYSNMLISSLGVTTDKNTENTLAVQLSFQEVIIVEVTTTQVPRIRQRSPGKTGKTEPSGKKSALVSLKEGIGL